MNQDATDALYRRAGLGHKLGFGDCPALLIVDMQVGFTDPAKSSLAGDFNDQIGAIGKLISSARASKIPVIFTVIAYESVGQVDGSLWLKKIPALRSFVSGSELVKLDPRLEADPGDLIIYKRFASAFFGTDLNSTLSGLAVDTLVIAGCTTSGCIRATVVDAISYGFRPIVPLEAIGDRAANPHQANVFDIDAKYGDVVAVDLVHGYFRQLQA